MDLHTLLKAHTGQDLLNELVTGRNINKYKKKQIIYSEGNRPRVCFMYKKAK